MRDYFGVDVWAFLLFRGKRCDVCAVAFVGCDVH